jgi:hypothetical protein
MHLFALFPDQRAMLCTADKDMVLFWVGLHASNFAFSHSRMTYDMTPTDLLPDITDEQRKMFTGS